MEMELTKRIKQRLRDFRPAYKSSERTIRWAEEVQTQNGFVDSIRFEDFVERDDSYCVGVNSEVPVRCKLPEKTFPCKECKGCVYRRNRYKLGILTTCFEVKITMSDFKSSHGHNFFGNHNYYVVPINIYNKVHKLVPHDIGILHSIQAVAIWQ